MKCESASFISIRHFFITEGNSQQNHQLSKLLTRKQHFYHKHRNVFTQGKTHVTITYHALSTFIHSMLESIYYSVIMYVSSQEKEWLGIGAEDIKDNRQSEKL
jgi:hypothetical protein